ncbi:MAG: polysaccharide biosynthesis C-terminal domain-containing protein [Bacteroidetes bacterium]|nr:polysaccharide biosynthesis C-terminal domain-containing protein [Bacteroidota bacterium]
MRICNYTVLLQLKSKGLSILTGSIIDFFFTILLMIILYPHFRLSGLAMAVVIATYIQAAFYLFKITRIYNKSLFDLFDLKKLTPIFIISFVPLLVIKFLLGPQLAGITFLLACIISVGTSIYFVNKKFDLKDLLFKKIF